MVSDQIFAIEQHTRAQHSCDLWFKHRAGQITASKIKTACRTDSTSPSLSLIKQICYLKQVGMMQASLEIPTFTKGLSQLSPVDVENQGILQIYEFKLNG